jgi:multicomponent Na+:H+ antiporter subunit G
VIPEAVYDVAASIMLIAGALLSLAAGIGLLRFPDALSRMHAATKPQIFGLILVLAAIALDQHTVGTIASLLVVLVFQMLTAPISAHMIGRAGYRNGDLLREQLVVDELDDAVARAAGEIAETTEGDVADLDVSDLPVGSADALAVELDRVGDSSGLDDTEGDDHERDHEGRRTRTGGDASGEPGEL